MTDPKLDEAARAGWLSYVAGRTQDEIARTLGVSRQKAQRLVSQAVAAGIVKVRIDHPIARCMELAAALKDRGGLSVAEVAPSDPDAPGLVTGVAALAATEMERVLMEEEPRILALGTGRALTAAVEQVARMERPQHRIVSLLGNMMRDGSASPFAATVRLAERIGARHYPMALPVFAQDAEEVAMLHAQPPVASTLELCARADVAFVGIAAVDRQSPMFVDGFVDEEEIDEMIRRGAVGEITGWAFDAEGRVLEGGHNERVAGAPLPDGDAPVIVVANGAAKVPAMVAAIRGDLIGGLITDEITAQAILERLPGD